ncbi:leukocyte immunoglobulin-like receptor subfamily A member 6 [Myotis yumanensis]|uniref:leukocyte immunoglobulin-like receptor subfamily A member 6 n=1 Tax=Myotis yumanensis TaxID=159337 RepID=UPI0038D467B3
MTPTLRALLCLGLSVGLRTPVQAGVVPKPSIWADPGPIVTKGSPVTIWCQGALQASAYLLYKERGSEPLDTKIPQDSSNKAGFLIEATMPSHAGLYQCAYYSTGNILSERSDRLLLVVTGLGDAPSLSAQPSPVVASGGNVSLSCSSWFTSGPFHLLKEGGAEPPQRMEAEWRIYAGRWQAIFPLGPVSTSHAGTYRCYGSSSSNPNVWSQPSAPLHIEVTGVHREPTFLAQPGSLVLPGHILTLQCHVEAGFDTFTLTKNEGLPPAPFLDTAISYEGHSEQVLSSDITRTLMSRRGSKPQDYTVENLIRMGLAGLVLVVLGVLLFQARNDTRRTHDATRI